MTLKSTLRTRPGSTFDRKKSATILTISSRRRRELKKESLQNAVKEFLQHFSERTLDAIVGLIRTSLEKLRRRLASTTQNGTRPTERETNAEKNVSLFSRSDFQSVRRTAHSERDDSTVGRRDSNVHQQIRSSDHLHFQIDLPVEPGRTTRNFELFLVFLFGLSFQNFTEANRFETSIEVPSSENDPIVVTQTNPNEVEENAPAAFAESTLNAENSTRDLLNEVPTHRPRGNTMLTIQEFIQPVKPQFTSGENFFKLISENKEINKLVGQLATCISVIRKVTEKNRRFSEGDVRFRTSARR